MRLVMVGTGPFAAPTFRGLLETHHQVVALVTSPIHPARGRCGAAATPMRDVAAEFDVPIFEPEDINADAPVAQLAACKADLLIVCDYGQILAGRTLATARLGGINLHGSLLPKYRGAAPIQWAIYHGETQTGVTVIHMTARVDAGPCIAQATTQIDPDETACQLEARLCQIGAWLVRRTVDTLEAGHLEVLPQDPALASRAPRLKKTDGLVDWHRSAEAIRNHIRAMEPWPKTYTFWHRPDGPPLRLILSQGKVVESPATAGPPGVVLEADGDRLVIATGQNALALAGVQPSGKRMLGVGEFLRGYRVQPGQRFSPEH